MTKDTKRQLKQTGGIVGVVVALFGVGVYVGDKLTAPAFHGLTWSNGGDATITDVWATTNLTDWRLVASVTNAEFIVLPPTNGAFEFHRISHRGKPRLEWETRSQRWVTNWILNE